MIPLFIILNRTNGETVAVNVNEIHSIQPVYVADGSIVTTNRERFYITDSFENVMATIQAASDGQYDKLSQTIVVKNK